MLELKIIKSVLDSSYIDESYQILSLLILPF